MDVMTAPLNRRKAPDALPIPLRLITEKLLLDHRTVMAWSGPGGHENRPKPYGSEEIGE